MLRFVVFFWAVLSGVAMFIGQPDLSAEDTLSTEETLTAEETLSTEVRNLVEIAIQEKKLPGAVVMIGIGDRTVLHEAYGSREVEPAKVAMTIDTVFDLASLTKPIATASSVMALIEREEIGLRDPVASHLPEFAVNGKDAVTVEQLLLHTGGLIPDNPMSDYRGSEQESIERLMKLSLNYPPGTRFRYSDVGFEVLGEWVRRVSGEDLHAFSQRHVFVPLGMTETTFRPESRLRQRAAPTQKRGGDWMRGEVHDPRAFALGGIAGHAGLFSTSADLAVFARMILGDGTLDEVSIFKPETIRIMNRAYPVPGGIRGLGWDKQTGYSSNRGRTMTASALGHGGFTGTALWIDPELQLYVIFLSNRVHPSGDGSVNRLAGAIGTLAADFAAAHEP